MQLIDQMQAAIGCTPDQLIQSPKVHRFSTNGKPGDKSGWYVHPQPDVLICGDWRTGRTATLFEAGKNRHDPDIELGIQIAREAYRKEQALRAEDARRKACYFMDNSQPLGKHPYLDTKKIAPSPDLQARRYKDSILIPLYNWERKLQGCQFIDTKGNKRFIGGTKKRASFHRVGKWRKNGKPIALVEGYATGCTVYNQMDVDNVVCCFDAGNLAPVLERLLILVSDRDFIIYADDDDINPKTGKRAGKVGAEKAASLSPDRVTIAYPDWPNGVKPEGCSDFNDLYCLTNNQNKVV